MATINRRKSQIGENHEISRAYEIFLQHKKSSCAQSTYFTYQDIGNRIIVPGLLKFASNQMMSDVDTVCLRCLLNEYEENHSNGGVNFVFRHLKAFINWYWNEYEIDIKNPIKSIKPKKNNLPPKEGITREEVNALIATAKKKSVFPERDIAIIMLLCDTGIRLSSLAGLKIKDVNTVRNEITVFEKDQQFHVKVYGNSCGRALRAYLRCIENARQDDSLWMQMDGNTLVKRGLREVLKRLCTEAGIKIHLFHDFRRFYGLELYKSTRDIYFVSRALDHKDIEVTKRYLAIDKMEDADALRAMSPMDNPTSVKIKRK